MISYKVVETTEYKDGYNMRCNVGDKVRIKTYVELVNEFGYNHDGEIDVKIGVSDEMINYCGNIMTVDGVGEWRDDKRVYRMEEDNSSWMWTDDLISYKIVETSSLYNDETEKYISDDVEAVMGAYEHYFDFDPVDKPSHYADKEIEVIDYIQDTLSDEEFEGYCMGNVIKYVSRYKRKNGLEDLKKARYYLNKVIDLYKTEV